MNYVSSMFLYVLINEIACPFFTLEREIGKGCSLSPLLFLIVAEGLCRVLIEAKRCGSFKGIKIREAFYLSHSSFVDEILIFHGGSRRDVVKLKEILDFIVLLQVCWSTSTIFWSIF
jgi:hypothetical protein